LATNTSNPDDPELEAMLEAARRANWDALHGPRHLRSGRFTPWEEDRPESAKADQPDAVADEPGGNATAKPKHPRTPRS
jgi:hypothetical protein